MSDYTKSTNFAAKDALASGNAAKVVKGTEIDTEFNNIATAIATKTDDSSAAITGGTIDGTAIGGTTPAVGAFTTLSASGAASFADGSASAPAITNTGDTNTGIFFPAADTIAFAEGGTESMRLDSAGNMGLGVTPSAWGSSWRSLDIVGGGSFAGAFSSAYMLGNAYYSNSGGVYKATGPAGHYGIEAGTHVWKIAPSGTAGNAITFTQAMTLDASGNLLVGTTSTNVANNTITGFGLDGKALTASYGVGINSTSATGTQYFVVFGRNSSACGTISSTATNSTTYATSSDYRLKENIAPMTGALDTIAQLNPVTYTWKEDGTAGQGFIAHELQAVVPDAVVGEKDAVNEDGSIKPQGIDTSYLVATLTAAIQEQQAIIETLTNRITALEAK